MANDPTVETDWQPVGGGNAKLTAWPRTNVDGQLIYPMNVALAHYQTGKSHRRPILCHYGTDDVTQNLADWFHCYNGRQTIEAGIKRAKMSSRCTTARSGPPRAMRAMPTKSNLPLTAPRGRRIGRAKLYASHATSDVIPVRVASSLQVYDAACYNVVPIQASAYAVDGRGLCARWIVAVGMRGCREHDRKHDHE